MLYVLKCDICLCEDAAISKYNDKMQDNWAGRERKVWCLCIHLFIYAFYISLIHALSELFLEPCHIIILGKSSWCHSKDIEGTLERSFRQILG